MQIEGFVEFATLTQTEQAEIVAAFKAIAIGRGVSETSVGRVSAGHEATWIGKYGGQQLRAVERRELGSGAVIGRSLHSASGQVFGIRF